MLAGLSRLGGGAVLHSPISFDLTVTALYGPLTCGGRVYLAALDEQLPVATGRERYAFLKATPSHLSLLGVLDERLRSHG